MHNEFTYIVEPPTDDDPWFIAFCPELPEANGQGKTEKEAIDSLREAIELVLSQRREESMAGVSSSARRGVVSVG
jgi:predicted RNase H-like HicB family nuclease